MRTFSHFLLTAGVGDRLRKRQPSIHLRAFLVGSVLPDLPLALLTVGYVIANAGAWWHRGNTPATTDVLMAAYHDLYFNNLYWIVSHNLFHAPVLIIVTLALSLIGERRNTRWGAPLRWLALGLALHSVLDILTHHDDGPLLFFPLNWSYRFPSPISYWDRSYYATIFIAFEYGLDMLLVAFFVAKGRHT